MPARDCHRSGSSPGTSESRTTLSRRRIRELESDGLVRSHGRRGTIVAGLPTAIPATEIVQREVDELVRLARDRGVDAATVLGLVSNALAAE